MTDSELLTRIREREWFYDFELPDGTKTDSRLPPSIAPIHYYRGRKLAEIIATYVPDAANLSALDLACHEGWFTQELAKAFRQVVGLDYRQRNTDAARDMMAALGIANTSFTEENLETMEFREDLQADFVLCYGLLYHLENPMHAIRLASQLSRKHLFIETQVFPMDIAGLIEDGSYGNQRRAEGVFGLVPDYQGENSGGPSAYALVPSLNALLFILRQFGFNHVEVIPPDSEAYEQFERGHRVLVYCRRD